MRGPGLMQVDSLLCLTLSPQIVALGHSQPTDCSPRPFSTHRFGLTVKLQAAILLEHSIEHIATKHGMDATAFRQINMASAETLSDKGVPLADYTLTELIETLVAKSEYETRKAAVDQFNSENKWKKRGIALTPARYGVTHGFAAGTSCKVNINAADGSIVVWHNGHEIGNMNCHCPTIDRLLSLC